MAMGRCVRERGRDAFDSSGGMRATAVGGCGRRWWGDAGDGGGGRVPQWDGDACASSAVARAMAAQGMRAVAVKGRVR
jgi:hypothetical protein